uniref:Uncharacterized protein n=1 Tax=Rhizophora mucronata TaxID=61149 RepID=A0A2P2N7E1_RHIMU
MISNTISIIIFFGSEKRESVPTINFDLPNGCLWLQV